ncbi:hypothetical protein PS627_00332 [Pseudomonas fluorescens]|uniref:hypothetical protein n=1 Tax=Pseudomonas fluorescens TaxID=294 RepID=UPI001256A2DC|nr:hypothetical protein [Pseudomonas fluorescens]CAG8863394.1 hypothetical protein PS627_00332 [Pseudomonas fluorescens]
MSSFYRSLLQLSILSTSPFLGDEHADYVKFLRAFLFRNGIVEERQTALWVFLGQASILSFVFAWISPKLYLLGVMARQRLWATPAEAFILNLMVPSRPLTSQLLASMNDKTSQYMFSMDDRKVYVGRVSSIGDLHEAGSMDEDFEIVPVMSGFRDKGTLKVTYTTDYSAVVEEMANRGRDVGLR